MARGMAVSQSAVSRIWRAFGLQPHRQETFKLSSDPQFVAKVRVPAELDVHLVMDNYGTHKTAAIRAWFARRPPFHVHLTPTSASSLNQVERWFSS